jgi:predicted type IV restriction endonuclease
MSVTAKVADRIRAALKRFQPILSSAKARDVNESDTVVLVTDLLQYLFGYDKYSEITSEHMIRSTFCDLAVNLENSLAFLIEVKAIGYELKDNHVKQAVDYAANKGCEWVCLTNGVNWRVYKVTFGKPIAHETVVEFDLLQMSHRDSSHVELLGLLSKEGWQKARIGEYHSHKQALSKFTLGAILVDETVLAVIRRKLRHTADGLKVTAEEIKAVLLADVIKRDVLEGEKAQAAQRQVARARRALERERASGDADDEAGDPASSAAGGEGGATNSGS